MASNNRQTELHFRRSPFYAGEEELLESYSNFRLYPVRVSDIYMERYKVVRKLGYGSFATVWLANDIR
jgi:serine/threonine protein kinase